MLINIKIRQFRQMLKTIHVTSPRNKQQHPLSQRDILHTIQQCPQIMKQDKLFIRNKIKQIFKQLHLTDDNRVELNLHDLQHQNQQQNQTVQLLQIFTQCNKPLHRIHLYENHSHWLQVKLRKYVANQKKKQKDQCLYQFKKQKCIEKANKNRMQRKLKQEKSQQKYQQKDRKYKDYFNFNHGRGSQFQIKSNNSQQKLRPCSPNSINFKQLNHPSRNKYLSGNISPNYERINKIGPQTCKNVKPQQNQNKSWNNTYNFNNKKVHTNSSLSKGKTNKSQISKYKQQIKKQMNNQIYNPYKTKIPEKQNSSNCPNILQSVVINDNNGNQQFPYIINESSIKMNSSNKFNKFQDSISNSNSNFNSNYNSKFNSNCKIASKNISNNKQPNFNAYDNKNNGIFNNFMKNQQFSTIKQKINQKNSNKKKLQYIKNFPININQNQNLYTSPELLEQCRRFLKNTQYDIRGNQVQTDRPSNFESFNAFEQVQCPEYHPPQVLQFAQQPDTSIFSNIKQLLKYIFKKDWTAYISNSDKQQIIQRCPIGYQQTVKSLLSQINHKTNFISFLQIFPVIRSQLKIHFSFSNIFLLLDVDNKGFVTHSDYVTFMQNFNNCPIEEQVLYQLKEKLFKLQQCLAQIFKGQQIIQGCLEYLQLIEKPEIFALGQVLEMFQFQIGSSCNTEGNEIQ